MPNWIRQTKQGEQEPACTHCKSKNLREQRVRDGKQIYVCDECGKSSYGLPPDLRPKCPSCKNTVWEHRLPDGRSRYICSKCGKSFLSEYKQARRDRAKVARYWHSFGFWLDRRARLSLGETVQARRCTDAQAIRAIFRQVLTGEVFGTGARARPGRPTAIPVPRDPAAAAMKFPDLRTETAKKLLAESGGHGRRGFQPTVLGVQQTTVFLDDEAKEGLVYAMRRLEMNHADAARWLLTNVKMPDADTPSYNKLHPPPLNVATSGRRISAQLSGRYDPDWDD
ncbi:MAG: zinc ribbon domain-containing protein [Fibrella sp.]|nr:zinc ribbon domain-containing protein [Armatimonadota bacterium]